MGGRHRRPHHHRVPINADLSVLQHRRRKLSQHRFLVRHRHVISAKLHIHPACRTRLHQRRRSRSRNHDSAGIHSVANSRCWTQMVVWALRGCTFRSLSTSHGLSRAATALLQVLQTAAASPCCCCTSSAQLKASGCRQRGSIRTKGHDRRLDRRTG